MFPEALTCGWVDGLAFAASDAREPVEPEVRVGSTRAPAKAGHRVDNLNRLQELEVLVSALSFDAKTERPAIASRKVTTVESVGKDRLRMLDLEQIVSLVPPIERIDDDVACGRRDAARLSSTRWSGAPVHSPIADQPCSHTWAVICVRAGRLLISSSDSSRGRSTRPLIGSRQFLNPSDSVALILLVPRVGLVPGRERVGNIASAVLPRQLLAGKQQPIGAHRQHVGGADQSPAHARRNERFARTSRQQQTTERGHARQPRTT